MTVFVCAQQADVEVEARKVEVVRISAELGDLELRRENQAHIVVAFVAIQIVDTTVVQRDNIATNARDQSLQLFWSSASLA